MKNISFFHSKKHAVEAIKPGKQSFFSQVGNEPFVDWLLIICASSALAAVLVVLGGYLYFDTTDQLAAPGQVSSGSQAAVHFDAKKLSAVIDVFDVRAEERVMLGKAYNGPRDPSLP
jgi:hypothetical protein